ncbi:MAG: heme ABC exporter ATP-binding protein CcmA, partial [Hyphomicrobiales bacterium]|nr:heme ABC exporter ATP-binding protein CcmA [Hyphomicrobiales bacterium]
MRLVAENVCVDRGGRRILEAVDFALSDGQALILSGPNGAGKSTLLRAIAGLLPLAAGRLTLDDDSEEIAASLHYIGHAEGMKPALTVRENLDFWSSFLSRESAAAALAPQDALTAFGLAHVIDIPAGYLSAGQKRRIALARLLVAPRPIWLLDEPTTALDVRAQAALAAVMARHRAGGGIVLAATHSPVGLENA